MAKEKIKKPADKDDLPEPIENVLPASNADFQRPARTGQPVTAVTPAGLSSDLRTTASASVYTTGGKRRESTEEEPEKEEQLVDTVEISPAARAAFEKQKREKNEG